MNLTIKSLKGEKFTVEAEGSATVANVKASIESLKGESCPADGMKLIVSGKVLKDSDTIEGAGVKEVSLGDAFWVASVSVSVL